MDAHSRQRLTSALATGVVYLALAVTAINLTRYHGGVAFASVANAALLARLLTLRTKHWLPHIAACAVASAFATASVGLGFAAAVPMVLMNIGEALIAASILTRATSGKGKLGSYAPLPIFLFAAGVAAPVTSAFGGAFVASIFAGDTYWGNWTNWYFGHALGALTFTPLAVYILRGDAKAWAIVARPAAAVEALALLLLIGAVTVAVFAQDRMPLLFVPMLPIILATFRIGRLAAAVSIALLTIIGGLLTLSGHGPVAMLSGSDGLRLQFLQFYLASSVLTILPVSAELTRQAALYRRLHESEARYRLLTEHSTDIILNLDIEGRVRFASPSIRQIGGYEPADVINRAAIDLVDPDDAPAVMRVHRAALSNPGQTFVVEYRARTVSGESRWFETHTRAVIDQIGEVTGVVSAIRDVGHRKAVERRLTDAAMTDGLTAIANRKAFDAALDHAIATAGSEGLGCVALFDLDNFKAVNDQHGHAAGDAVLRAFADLARGRMRDKDFVGRFGGEEFGIILPGATLEQARLVCDRLRQAVAEMPIAISGSHIRVTVSGGVASYICRSHPAEVLAAADAALYVAKRSGRDQMRLAA